jgi:hypothetical protein
MQGNQLLSKLAPNEQSFDEKLMLRELPTRATAKTSTILSHFLKVEQISSLILELFPNIKTEALAEIQTVLSNEMTVRLGSNGEPNC